MARTTRWARRCAGGAARRRASCASASCRAASHLDLRRAHLAEIAALPFDGLALGGLGVGEAPEVMYAVIDAVAAELPADRPRYLMGVGTPEDIWTAIGAGIDMFDCVMPTRNARNGQLFVRGGRLNIAQRAAPRRSAARSRRAARASAARATAAPTSRTCSTPRSCSTTGWRASTTSQHYLSLRAAAARAGASVRRGAFPAVAVVDATRMAKRVGVMLSGAGASTAATSPRRCWRCWSIERAGAEAICAAPDVDQRARRRSPDRRAQRRRPRNARAEAARIAGPHGRCRCPRSTPNAHRRADRAGRRRGRSRRCPTTPRSTSSVRSIPTSRALLRAHAAVAPADGLHRPVGAAGGARAGAGGRRARDRRAEGRRRPRSTPRSWAPTCVPAPSKT